MIDWVNVAFQSLWIFGTSLLLAQFSYRRWARQEGIDTGTPSQRLWFSCSVYVLIGIGVIGVNDGLLLRIGWIVTIVLALVSAYLTYREEVSAEK